MGPLDFSGMEVTGDLDKGSLLVGSRKDRESEDSK